MSLVLKIEIFTKNTIEKFLRKRVKKWSSLKNLQNKKNYSFNQTDIINSKAIQKILNKFKPNYIFHLAAETHVDRSIKNPHKFLKTNIKTLIEYDFT